MKPHIRCDEDAFSRVTKISGVEYKQPARLGWWKYKRQAFGDAGEKIPTVMMRPNDDTEWMIAIPVARLREFVQRINETENTND